MPYRIVNPAAGEVLKSLAEHTDQQVMDALATADRAFRTWSARPFSERSKIIGDARKFFSRWCSSTIPMWVRRICRSAELSVPVAAKNSRILVLKSL